MGYDLRRLKASRIFADVVFALFAFSCALALIMLGALAFIKSGYVTGANGWTAYRGQSFGDTVVFYVGGDGLYGLFSHFPALFCDRVFAGRRIADPGFINDKYLTVGLWYAFTLSALGAVSAFFASKAAGRGLFDRVLFDRATAGKIKLSALFALLAGLLPAAVKYFLVISTRDMTSMYSVHGFAPAAALFALAMITDGGSDLVPKPDEEGVEEGSGKTTAMAKLSQNARMLSSILWIAALVVIAALVFVLFSLIPVIPYLGKNSVIELDGSSSIFMSTLLGTLEKADYSPVYLFIRYLSQAASIALALAALLRANAAVKRLRHADSAFCEQTASAFRGSALLALIGSCLSFSGSLACSLMENVRFRFPTDGLLCAALLLACAWAVERCSAMREEKERRKEEKDDDISDLSFIIR